MKNSFNYYPELYKIIVVVVCVLLVLFFNKSRANQKANDLKNSSVQVIVSK